MRLFRQVLLASAAACSLVAQPPDWLSRTLKSPGPPNWSTFTTNWAAQSMNVGGFPSNALFGNGTTFLPEAIRGAIRIPATASAGNHAAGVAGYAMTDSTVRVGVGLFGWGGQSVASGAWSLNTIVSNGPKPQTEPNTGLDFPSGMNGYELDLNIMKKFDGTQPTGYVQGIGIVGASETKGTVWNYAVNVASLGHFGPSPSTVFWDSAFRTQDGAATVALEVGSNCVTAMTNCGSQLIHLNSFLSSVSKQASIYTGQDGSLYMTPGLGGQVILTDGSTNTGLSIVPNGTTPWVNIDNQLRIQPVAFASLPSAISAGAMVYCTNCTLAATCAAGGTGHVAVSNGSAWTCN